MLPAVLVNTEVRSRPELAAHLEQRAVKPGDTTYYRCRECGTLWEEQRSAFMHADVDVVLKSVLNTRGEPRAIWYDVLRGQLHVPDE